MASENQVQYTCYALLSVISLKSFQPQAEGKWDRRFPPAQIGGYKIKTWVDQSVLVETRRISRRISFIYPVSLHQHRDYSPSLHGNELAIASRILGFKLQCMSSTSQLQYLTPRISGPNTFADSSTQSAEQSCLPIFNHSLRSASALRD